MKNQKVIFAALGILLLVTAGIVYTVMSKPKVEETPVTQEDEFDEELPPVTDSVTIEVVEAAADNTIEIRVSGLGSTMTSIAYELTYESEGLVKGVNSGSKPIDVSGQDSFEREVYLGTCSRNVCKPDVGVTEVSLDMIFTDTDGAKSQFSGDFEL